MKSQRFQFDQDELAQRISRLVTVDSKLEVQPGLFLNRVSQPGEVVHAVSEPCFCVIAQGAKEVSLGDTHLRYDTARYLITTMELPVSGKVIEATTDKPYLNFRMVLQPSIVTSVLAESGYAERPGEPHSKSIAVSVLDDELLNSVLRLVRMLDHPLEYQVLAESTMREIVFRLLTGDQGNRLRYIARLGGRSQRIVRAITAIRERFDQPIRIEDLAGELSMSVSSFHAHFKAATSMTPLQFQKQLRLQEARRLLMDERTDAAEAGFSVGYEDAAQFNREYKRHFGLPPKRDVARAHIESGNTSS